MVKKLRIRESVDSSWQDHLPRDVFNRLSECRTRKDDIVPLAVAYYQYKLKDKGGSWTPEDALIAIWEWVDCNGQNMDFTKDEYNDMLFDINRLCGFNTLPYDESYKGRKKFKEARYSDVVPYEKRKYWYFTTHGIGPGTIPPGVHLLDVVEGQNKKGTWGDFLCLDAILNTSELRQYDLIELAPDNVYESVRDKNNFKIGDKVKSKSFNRNVTDMAFNGTIIDIDEDGLCTVECSDGDVVDGILPNRLVKVTDECFISENLSTNDAEHMWFVCDKDMNYVRAISEEECNDLVYCTVYEMLVNEGIVDEDDETYCNNSKLYQDFRDNIIEAKYTLTKTPKGLPTFKGNIIMKDRDYVGPLPFGYYVDENDDLISPTNRVVAHNIRSLY